GEVVPHQVELRLAALREEDLVRARHRELASGDVEDDLLRHRSNVAGSERVHASMAFDLVIEIENEPGALARVAAAISDAAVNLAAATCMGTADRVELHVLVPHAEAARHALALSQLAVTREREVVVVDVEDRPGVLADLTRKVARAGVDLDLVYVATRDR